MSDQTPTGTGDAAPTTPSQAAETPRSTTPRSTTPRATRPKARPKAKASSRAKGGRRAVYSSHAGSTSYCTFVE